MSNSDMLGSVKVRKLIFMLGWPAALNFWWLRSTT